MNTNLVFILVFETVLVISQDFFVGVDMPIGCFLDKTDERDLPHSQQILKFTQKTCRESCAASYYKYAGLQNGQECFCGGSFGKFGPGQCTSMCRDNLNETCGGPISNTIFNTGFKVPGPPGSLELVKKSPTSLYFKWSEPESSGKITEFQLNIAIHLSHHPGAKKYSTRLLRFSESTHTARIQDLLPGTQYNVSISANSQEGLGPPLSNLYWTEIGKPATPPIPKLNHDLSDGTLNVNLEPVEEHGGPISSYQVIVIDETNPVQFDPDNLYNYNKAMDEGVHYWIAAELPPEYLASNKNFVVGDGQLYGGYWNYGPLLPDHDYHVSLAVVSTLHGVTKTSYAKVSHRQHSRNNMVVLSHQYHESSTKPSKYDKTKENNIEAEGTSPLVIGLTVAIAVSAVVLLVALGLFIYLRNSVGKRLSRRRGDTQELTSTQASSITNSELVSNGYLDDGYDNQAISTADEYLDSLKSKVWIIPRNFVEISHEVLGRGKFGSVIRGSVSNNGELIPCNTQVIANKILDHKEKKAMVKDLEASIRASRHPNLVCLIGICQEQDVTMVVMDHAEPSLKQFLLDSRALLNYPVYAQKNNRFSTAREEVLLDILTGIASGFDHLRCQGVNHEQLCARNMLMYGESGAKIAGFGMSDWHRGGENIDYTRWKASEALMNKQSGPKCDVWSFGCLLWEVATLGGTPYGLVKTKDVGVRVLKGLRPQQTMYMSDQLYQLMLVCWMTDPDERPTSQELVGHLQDMQQDGCLHLSFNINTSDFQYEVFSNDLELVN